MTSGEEPTEAMKKRRTGDRYKDCHCVNLMIAIYVTEDQGECREVEKRLIKTYESNPNLLNRTGGGGGRTSYQPRTYLYLGLSVEVEESYN